MVNQILGTYFEDNCADELTNDPVLTTILGKKALAFQPTLSRFFNRMDATTLCQFYDIMRKLHKVVYVIKKPQLLLLDLDSTLLDTYGHQEGEGFNFHYRNHGYHPLVCYDGMTGDLLKIELHNGTDNSCTGVVDFLQLLLDEFLADYPEILLLLRGDSGFATPDLYTQCETNGISYVIRLKENCSLRALASDIEERLIEMTKKQRVDNIRLKLLKIAAKVVHSARYTIFKLCSSCPYKDKFYETLENIRNLQLKLE